MTEQEALERIHALVKLQRSIPRPPAEEFSERTQMEVLRLIACNESRAMTPGRLQEALGVGSSRVANVLKTMEAKKLVARRKDPSDGRKAVIVLLPAGEKKMEEKNAELCRMVHEIYVTLGGEEFETILSSLDVLFMTLKSLLEKKTEGKGESPCCD